MSEEAKSLVRALLREDVSLLKIVPNGIKFLNDCIKTNRLRESFQTNKSNFIDDENSL